MTDQPSQLGIEPRVGRHAAAKRNGRLRLRGAHRLGGLAHHQGQVADEAGGQRSPRLLGARIERVDVIERARRAVRTTANQTREGFGIDGHAHCRIPADRFRHLELEIRIAADAQAVERSIGIVGGHPQTRRQRASRGNQPIPATECPVHDESILFAGEGDDRRRVRAAHQDPVHVVGRCGGLEGIGMDGVDPLAGDCRTLLVEREAGGRRDTSLLLVQIFGFDDDDAIDSAPASVQPVSGMPRRPRRKPAGLGVADAGHPDETLLRGRRRDAAVNGQGGRGFTKPARYSEDVHGDRLSAGRTGARRDSRRWPDSRGCPGETRESRRRACRRSALRAC